MAAEQLGTLQPDGMTTGTSSVPYELNYDKTALAIYTTCDSTNASTSFVPVLFDSAITGAGQVGGRVLCDLAISAAAGGWTNALKGIVTYSAAGSTSGLGSAICAEMALSAGTTSGTYAPLEIELVLASGAQTGTNTSFMHMQVSGADKTTLDTYGSLFTLTGVTSGSECLWYAADLTLTKADGLLKIKINGTTYYIICTTATNGG